MPLRSPSTTQIRDIAALARAYIEKNGPVAATTSYGRVSPFWQDVLEARPSAPTENDLLAFRRSSYAYGVGDDRKGDEAEERSHAHRMACVVDQFVPKSFLSDLYEPSHGAPLVYDFDGLPFSASFRVNAGTSYRIRELMRRFGRESASLLVCEIGPGWGGCAVQLHQVLDIAKYVMVDLPQNLFLSSTYVAAVLFDKTLEFLDVEGPSYTPSADKQIVAMVPPALSRVACRFDLIINSFSLQEMDAGTVDAYLEWATRFLADDGIFVSFNAHGKAGIQRGSDYGFGRFDVCHVQTFRRIPTGFFNTIPYEVVLRRRVPTTPPFDERGFAALADLMQLGLDDELADFHGALVAGALTQRQRSLLHSLDDCFTAVSADHRERALVAAQAFDDGAIVPFVRGNLQFAAGAFTPAETSLNAAAERNLGGFAKVRCEVMRAFIRQHNGYDSASDEIFLPDDATTTAAAVYPEIPRLLASGNPEPIQGHINRIIRRSDRPPPRRNLLERVKGLMSRRAPGRT